MAEAKTGDKVKVHYKGMLEDGKVFDKSYDREPLEFTIGDSRIIPGFEDAVIGMTPGEKTTTSIPCDKAYGEHRENLVATIDRSELPEDIDPEEGQHLKMQQPNGQDIRVTVTDKDESTITLDANQPLAGHELTFEIELLEIK